MIWSYCPEGGSEEAGGTEQLGMKTDSNLTITAVGEPVWFDDF